MTDPEIVDLINSSLVKEFELDPATLKPDVDLFQDLGFDSLDLIDMVVLLESVFQFKARDEEAIRKIRKLGEIYEFVLAKKNELQRTAS